MLVLEELVLSWLFLLCAFWKAMLYDIDCWFLILFALGIFFFILSILQLVSIVYWPKSRKKREFTKWKL